MIRTIQLYIENERVDLFGDEAINITESIKNAKDISKVFTTFSQQFTVPASKTNNKIFKHYYNYDIDSPYDFDARKKTAARIEINHLPFKNGRIKLEGVSLRDNKPYTYRITFYGSIVDLKDLVGEDKLPNLTAFQSISKPYDINSLISDLTQNATADYALAMITAGQRLYYDSELSSQGSGNIHYDGITAQGLKPQQLKYAVKLSKILEAIESQYDSISFASNTFFNPSESNDLDELYMWLHRKNDTVEIVGGGNYSYGFSSGPGVSNGYYEVDAATGYSMREVDVITVMDSDSGSSRYDIIITVNDEVHERFDGLIGDQTRSIEIGDSFDDGDLVKVRINTYEEEVRFDDMKMEFTYFEETQGGINDYTEVADALAYNIPASYVFNISENIPEIKVIDFLSGLFKMFNLVAYVDDNGYIVTKTLDEFYREGNTYDISKYIDISNSEVNTALPFKEIFFKYKDTKTILAEQHYQEISTVEWGGVEYTTDSDLSGDIYKVEPPFNHSKFEKLLDVSNTNFSTDVQVGYFVTDNEEAYLGDPLIFYIVPQSSAVRISYTKDGNLVNSPSLTGTINMPSNSKTFDAAVSEENIHFNAELNEFTGTAFEDTLFKRYYERYITSVFNRRNRLTKVTSYLPVNILREIELNDTITINGRNYIINSMNVNINTGKVEFELLNKYSVNAIWDQVEETWSTITDTWISI